MKKIWGFKLERFKVFFSKHFKQNITAQHRTNERSVKYMLEIYQNKCPEFICGSLTSTKTLGQDEEIQARPSGIA
jgi:hypothetical protein